MVWGACFGLSFYPWIGLISIPLGLLSAFFWALSGAGYPKFFRRILIPWLACLCVYLVKQNPIIFISWPLASLSLSCGYGIPDSSDKGSAIGRFWYKHVGLYADLFTRGTIILMLIASYFTIWMI